jgi:hypothetical protein
MTSSRRISAGDNEDTLVIRGGFLDFNSTTLDPRIVAKAYRNDPEAADVDCFARNHPRFRRLGKTAKARVTPDELYPCLSKMILTALVTDNCARQLFVAPPDKRAHIDAGQQTGIIEYLGEPVLSPSLWRPSALAQIRHLKLLRYRSSAAETQAQLLLLFACNINAMCRNSPRSFALISKIYGISAGCAPFF